MFETIWLPIIIITAIGLLSGIILAAASKFMAVPVDQTIIDVREALPGANCGACGFAGCDEYAEKLAHEDVKTNLCIPGGDEVSKKISDILGVEYADVIEMVAVVKCRGHLGTSDYIMDWQGPASCKISNQFYQGRRACSHACLGFGDCVVACNYDAISVNNGVAVVDKAKCVGCGLCAKECPNGLIDIIPAAADVYVACSSTDKGAFTRKICQNGCIGCRKCEKVCESDAINIRDNLASVNTDKCINCKKCVTTCPTGAIMTFFK